MSLGSRHPADEALVRDDPAKKPRTDTGPPDKTPASPLALKRFYDAVTSEPGIHLLIDGYVMGEVEACVYNGANGRFALYRGVANLQATRKAPSHLDMTHVTDDVTLTFEDVGGCGDGYVTLNVDLDGGHEYPPGHQEFGQAYPLSPGDRTVFAFLDRHQIRCVAWLWLPEYEVNNEVPDEGIFRTHALPGNVGADWKFARVRQTRRSPRGLTIHSIAFRLRIEHLRLPSFMERLAGAWAN